VFVDADDIRRNDRIKAVLGAALFEAALAYVLIVGLGVRPTAVVNEPLQLIGILPERPPPPPPEKKAPPKPRPQKEGAASPPNLKATPTEIVRPPPPVKFPPPPPVAAAPIAGPGAAPNAGAAPIRGPGTGSGGLGHGTGSGNGGNGPGGGGDGGGGPPRWLKGEIKDKDYPRASAQAGVGGTVSVRFAVEPNGRADDCVVTHSSGHEDIDEATCRLIEQRFRYRPGTDRAGRPVRTFLVEKHTWSIHRPGDSEPPDDAPDDGD
jgi:protein TonB